MRLEAGADRRRMQGLGFETPELERSMSENGPGMVRGRGEFERLIDTARADPEVLAVIQFGSTVRGVEMAASDIDICLVFRLEEINWRALSRKMLDYAGLNLDIHAFVPLPHLYPEKDSEGGEDSLLQG